MNTIIEIPETHSIGKNMWIIKAINLCQGKCMQIAHNFNQMLKILNKSLIAFKCFEAKGN